MMSPEAYCSVKTNFDRIAIWILQLINIFT